MIREIAAKAKKATFGMASLGPEAKNNALAAIREGLDEARERIFQANERDLALARQEDLTAALVKRLKFDTGKLEATLEGIESLIGLEDPVGKTISCTELDQGLELYKITCPIGLLGIIFESRPYDYVLVPGKVREDRQNVWIIDMGTGQLTTCIFNDKTNIIEVGNVIEMFPLGFFR